MNLTETCSHEYHTNELCSHNVLHLTYFALSLCTLASVAGKVFVVVSCGSQPVLRSLDYSALCQIL